jgi:List-Bact-rpt repeat protein
VILVAASWLFASTVPAPALTQAVRFTARTDLTVGTSPHAVGLGNFDRDGVEDLAGANYGSGAVSVLLGNGTVTSSPAGINCGIACSASYHAGPVVTLTATPATGSLFTGWSGCDLVSGNTCTVTMSAARSVNADFTGAPPLL